MTSNHARRTAAVALSVGLATLAPMAASAHAGSHWSPVPSPNPGLHHDTSYRLNDVSCATASSCVAAGSFFNDAVPTKSELLLRLGSSGWQPISPPRKKDMAAVFALSCATTSSCLTVGYRTNAQGHDFPTAQRVTGGATVAATKHLLGHGHGAENLSDVACASAHHCLAVGYLSGGVLAPLVLLWNGHRWRQQPTPNPGATSGGGQAPDPVGSILDGISCSSRAHCVAVGSTTTARINSHNQARMSSSTFALQLRHGHWHTTPTPDWPGNAYLTRVACPSASQCYAVGAQPHGESQLGFVERWNAGHWSVGYDASSAHRRLSDIACVTATKCFATTGDSNTRLQRARYVNVLQGHARHWHLVKVHAPKLPELHAVACRSVSTCFAVGAFSRDGGFTYPSLILRK